MGIDIDTVTYVWLLVVVCVGIVMFFVGGKHKERVLRLAGKLKDTLGGA